MSTTATYTPTVYDISLRRRDFAIFEVYNNGVGRSVVEDGFQCEAEAQNRIDELLSEEAEERAEQAEAAAAEAAEQAAVDAKAALIVAVSDFLWAADRGRFGSALHCDGEDSAYVTDLRNKLALVEMTAAIAEAHA